MNKNAVFVLDTNKKPCNPVHPAVARKLLNLGKAAVFRRYPFTIIAKEESKDEVKKLRIKIDPGAKTTGLAIVSETNIVWCAELEHRGFQIREKLNDRRTLRRSRRNRKTRYRKARFLNRKRPKGWLPPSLMSRVYNIESWVKKLCRLAPISAISQELVRFDTQKMINPEINGAEYQRGELFGYEVREYLLEKFNRTCVYCNTKEGPFNLDHFHPKSKGGSNRVSNLVLSCVQCNQKKDNQLPTDFLSDKPKLLAIIEKQRKNPLADAAAVNATRGKLKEVLESTGLNVEVGSGGLTKFNRKRLGISKSHWTDAACVGKSTPNNLNIKGYQPLLIKAMGRGTRQMVNSDKYGFPRGAAKLRQKSFFGFQTGDMVKAVVPKGKYTGTHTGRMAVRKKGNFKLKTSTQTFDVNHKYCQHIHKSDGFGYSFGELVKQKVKVIKPVNNQPINPTQLNLFNTIEFFTQTTKTKTKRTRKFKGTDGEQLSLF
ncbi:RNA-guided endonuclease IscB [Laspinema olomoucense]|uniref:RNA-guided endonuclease IscB n=1 Tax=Laspinema olomoucense TaxID=3231600 RepID=UPI0021BB0B6B|nr:MULTISPECIES: RNA-guided endonuclease IscB [unclassified Laspinema]MCT7973704.1 RNA-guided endonuclease IscB [Laspinema sp. D3d]MCT7996597.1 RNA-guided endonuclease IscB [Laspinema sp. D3c]